MNEHERPARPGHKWLRNFRTGKWLEHRIGDAVPDGFGVSVRLSMTDGRSVFTAEELKEMSGIHDQARAIVARVLGDAPAPSASNPSRIAVMDRDPVARQTARQLLGDAEFFKMEAEGGRSPVRAAVAAFWGRDEGRTEAQVVGLFDAIKPLLASGITSMVQDGSATTQRVMTPDEWKHGGKPINDYERTFAERSGGLSGRR